MNHSYYFLIILFVLLSGCKREINRSLDQALELAGKNDIELEKVLNHYKNDSLKLKAAEFLIMNMPGAFSNNKETPVICRPFYEAYDSLGQIYHYEMTTERGKQIDSLWNNFSNRYLNLGALPLQSDIENISSEQLISEIDLAFKAWRENKYTKEGSFEEFCEYILPYRRMNGLLIDDARKTFYLRHHGKYFTMPGKDLIDEADSLLYQYHHLTHSKFWGTQIPVLSAATFEYLRHGLCEHRCWYNSLLFSSLGIGAAVDFVPAWGNRNNNHTWNVLIKDGMSYAFEAFWDKDRWKYKRIYNNKTFDYNWGRFRLAKVYRHSFKNYLEGPITDKRVKPEDIPDLFRNFKKKDVSHEYFDTVNVSIRLKDIPKDTHYAYLCVLNYYQWQPVQWGKIEKDRVTFCGMGKDVIYLPCYYKNGTLIHAGVPFLLNTQGELETFRNDISDTEDLYIKHYAGAPLHYGNKWNNISIEKTSICGSSSSDFSKGDTICILPDSIEIYNKTIKPLYQQPVRYLRVSLPYHKIAFSNLAFYYKDTTGKEKKIENVTFVNPLDSTENGETTDYIFDDYIATGYKKELNKDYFELDLGNEYRITSICFAPYFEAGLKKDVSFELFYWNDGWKSIGKQNGADKHVVFKNVPKGALFLLRHQNVNDRPGSRLFIYQDHEVKWH
jgi:hypothetical protein